jgi:processive 1,2-diacylglycerol beta-glucosyltransferase
MIELRDKETGLVIGSITEEQLQFMIDQLEEESDADADYYLDSATLDLFAEKGSDPQLLTLLREALGEREGMEVEWSRKE